MSVSAIKNKFRRLESKISRDIRIISEVEKIWIKYDLDDSRELDYTELSEYLRKTAYPHITLPDHKVRAIFDHIDVNGDENISKKEMYAFI